MTGIRDEPRSGHQLSRRRLLQAAGLGVGVSLAAPSYAAAAAQPGAVSADQLSAWSQKLASFGTRLTGSPAQSRYVDWLADKFEDTGLAVQRDRLAFTRWAPQRWSLTIEGKTVDLAFYFPYSGETPPQGVNAPLVYLGPTPLTETAWAAARGKIAVVEVDTPPLPLAAVFPETGRYAPDMASPEPLGSEPGVSDIAAAPQLQVAALVGVLGVVCIRTGVSDALAKDQYSPFTTAHQGCPAVWVGPTAGQEVKAKALRGAAATLTMHALLTSGAATETIWSVLPGSDPTEAVVINTHTDGPNVLEENGGLGLLALAREFTRIPRSKRRRSLIFVATTGHFQLPQFAVGTGQSASRWMADHPELINGTKSKVVAALTLEHLGCREWLDNSAHTRYGPTGRQEVGYCYTPTPMMRKLYLDSCAGTANRRTITVQPTFYFGEGHDFNAAGIPTASLIPVPSYLVAAPQNGALGRLDKKLMQGQIATFSNLARALEKFPATALGTPAI